MPDLPVPERRWRCVQQEDPSWQYEERDPSFRPKLTKAQGETDVRGWRPLACIWYVGAPEEWRLIIGTDLGPQRTPRVDIGDLPAAKRYVEMKLDRE